VLLVAAGIVLVPGLALAIAGLYGAAQLTRPRRCDIQDSAARWGLPDPECVRFSAPDGLGVSGWWFESADANASVVVCHGYGGNKESNLWFASILCPRFNVLLIDTRGHGESDGARTSIGYLERLDIVGAVAWTRDRVGPKPVGLLGMSMGGAAAVLAAADCPEVGAVVADSPFARLRTPVRLSICQRGYPKLLSPTLAWAVCTTSAWLLGTVRGGWPDPMHVVNRIAPRPLLIIHGGADDLIPVQEAEALYRLAGEPKELWVVPGVGHARVAEADPPSYSERVTAFFQRSLAPRQVQPGVDRLDRSA
jgi:pimeloyl-ACP methyl ester carboxylesterase